MGECDNEDSDPKKRCDAAEKVVVECPTGGNEQWCGVKDINGVLVKKWCEDRNNDEVKEDGWRGEGSGNNVKWCKTWHERNGDERTECHCIADSCNTKVQTRPRRQQRLGRHHRQRGH